MSHKQRHDGRSYYYRKQLQGSKVVSTYVGAGRLAALAAQYDALEREQRQEQRQAIQAAREAEQAAEQPLALSELIELLPREHC